MDVAQFRGIRSPLNSSFLDWSFGPSFTVWCGDLFLQRSFGPNLTMEFFTLAKATLGITWAPALAISQATQRLTWVSALAITTTMVGICTGS